MRQARWLGGESPQPPQTAGFYSPVLPEHTGKSSSVSPSFLALPNWWKENEAFNTGSPWHGEKMGQAVSSSSAVG